MVSTESANRLVANLASITTSDMASNTSILPLDLGAAIFVLDASLEYVNSISHRCFDVWLS